MMNNKNEILLTGATGYIGYNFALFLNKKGFNTHILVRKNSNLRGFDSLVNIFIHYYDGNYYSIDKIFSEHNIKIVIHLATHYDKSDDLNTLEQLYSVSIDLTNHLFAAIKKQSDFIGLVNIGTIWQLHENFDNAYSLFKMFQDELSKYYSLKYNINVISLLIRDSYGPDDWRSKFLNQLKLSIDDNIIFHIANPNTNIQLIYIDDICEALYHSMNLFNRQSTSYSQYKLVALEKVRLVDLIKYIESIIGKPIKTSHGDVVSDLTLEIVKESDLDQLPGFSPKIKLAQGLARVFSK